MSVSPSNGELDFEGTFASYNATVTATTSYSQPLSASTPIFISLSNVMERPYFVPGALALAGLANPGVRIDCMRITIAPYSPTRTFSIAPPLFWSGAHGRRF